MQYAKHYDKIQFAIHIQLNYKGYEFYMRSFLYQIQELKELCFWTLSIIWCLKNKQN